MDEICGKSSHLAGFNWRIHEELPQKSSKVLIRDQLQGMCGIHAFCSKSVRSTESCAMDRNRRDRIVCSENGSLTCVRDKSKDLTHMITVHSPTIQ